MALSFPANPSVNDTYTEGSRTWKWNGTKWELVISTLVAGSVSTAEINNGAVTAAKLADGAVTSAKIADNAVTAAKLANSAVTSATIADNAVTAAKLATTAAIQPTIVDAKGDLIVGTGADTVARQAVGTDGHVLTADSAETNGIKWALSPETDLVTTKGDLLVATAADTLARLGVGINGYRVTAASGESSGLKYDMPSVPVFATTAARDAAFGGTGEKVLAEGQVCYRVAAPKNLQVYNGSAWIAFDISENGYTPTLTNVTLGNGTINGVYQRIGQYCVFGFHLSFGSTTSVSGLIGISLPFTADTGANTRHWFNVGFSDTGTTQYNGIGTIAESGTRVNMYAILASGTYTSIAGSPTSATVPHTWTTADEIFGSSIYRMA